MTWQEGVGIVLVCVGLLAGVYVAAQRPSFWLEFGARILQRLAPRVIAYLTKRMTPEKEAEMHRCIRSGGTWDHVRKRCKR